MVKIVDMTSALQQVREKAPDTADAMKRHKAGKSGFTDKAHLKAKGLIPRVDGTKKVSDKYKEDLDKDDVKTIKPIIKQLQKSVKSHDKQAKQLTKDISDENEISCKQEKSRLDYENLEDALSKLKNNKSRDFEGLANEIFKENTIGTNLKKSLLTMFNNLKKKNLIPKFLNFSNITTVPKKGSLGIPCRKSTVL